MRQTNTLTIDGHDLGDMGLVVLDGFELPLPEPKTYLVDVPGSDGLIDLTEFAGDIAYQPRSQTFTLAAVGLTDRTAQVLQTRLARLVHGRRKTFALGQDHGWTYTGRLALGTPSHDSGTTVWTWPLTVTADPYKTRDDSPLTWLINAAGGVTLKLPVGRRRVCPTIQVRRTTLVSHGGRTWTLQPGASRIRDLWLSIGDDEMTINTCPEYSVAAWADVPTGPNLTPFFSHSLTDTAYWQDIDTTHVTQLADGWAHVACDNSAGTSVKFINAYVAPQSFVVGGKIYTTMAEIRNTSGVTSSSLAVLSRDGDITQLVGDANQRVNPIEDGTYYFPQQTPNVNLIAGTRLFGGSFYNITAYGSVDTTNLYDSCAVYTGSVPTGNTASYRSFDLVSVDNAIAPDPDTDYVLSFWAKGSVAGQRFTSFFYPSTCATTASSTGVGGVFPDGRCAQALTTDWQRYWVRWHTLSSVSGTKNLIVARISGDFSGAISVAGVKLEQSSAATAYAPAAGELSSFTGGLNRSCASIPAGENVSFDLRLSLYEGTYAGEYVGYGTWAHLADERWSDLAAGDTPPQASDTWEQHEGVTWASIGTKRWVELSHGAETGDEYAAYIQYDYKDL